jgi:glutaredoxin
LIFSKTHCPYSATAKQILTGKYHTVPPPFIVELDQHPKGSELQDALADLTGRKTVPVSYLRERDEEIGG